jgi:hypothetical protein
MIKSRMMKWAEHVAIVSLGKPEGCERIILKWILERYDGVVWTRFI